MQDHGQDQDQDQILVSAMKHNQDQVGADWSIFTRPTRVRQVKPSPTVRAASQVHVLWPSPVLLHTA